MYTSIYRAKTSIQQKLPAQLEEKLEKFVKNIKSLRVAHGFPDDLIINMDETPMYFDMPSSHTVHKKLSGIKLILLLIISRNSVRQDWNYLNSAEFLEEIR